MDELKKLHSMRLRPYKIIIHLQIGLEIALFFKLVPFRYIIQGGENIYETLWEQ